MRQPAEQAVCRIAAVMAQRAEPLREHPSMWRQGGIEQALFATSSAGVRTADHVSHPRGLSIGIDPSLPMIVSCTDPRTGQILAISMFDM
ncbi:hypothetical protein [Phytohabitans rumicis]|uniref:hypothetical protein n=1 Tax=Phytohabitans rumicis TaxID=1076125 RepID=UPI001563B49F|nr:hypothetical protein [Phytohabitans rumicis]